MYDTGHLDVHELSNIFRRDWDRMRQILGDPNLVVAPDNARGKLTDLIRRAHSSIKLYAEEINDPGIESLLVAASRRHVAVRIILEAGSSPPAAAFLRRSRVSLRELRRPYIHAKAWVIDHRLAFVGSENISAASLDLNREAGILIRGAAVRVIESTFDADWRSAR